METTCPALFFCAPASGQGKTTITAGIARHHSNKGLDVRVFKTGPDYLDPLILERASRNPVTQLDLWMVGKEECRDILYGGAHKADLILVEGVMGMFDGDPSGADMAELFGIPVAMVIDARAMAQTFGAIALGLANHRSNLEVAGVIANNLGSDRHRDLVMGSVPEGIDFLGGVPRSPEIALPERHLGLVHPHEVDDMDSRLDGLADVMHDAGLTELPQPVTFSPGRPIETQPLMRGMTIGIARDDAFTFIYQANVDLLEAMGANCVFFSPLNDHQLPQVDALWLPGGYPELHLGALAQNEAMYRELQEFKSSGRKILAECGGMLYLMDSLTTVHGESAKMAGLIPGNGIMRDRGGCQGMQTAPLPEGEVRAHAHHRTRVENTLKPVAFGRRARHPAPGEPIYRDDNVTASYLHLYFPSNPEAIARILS